MPADLLPYCSSSPHCSGSRHRGREEQVKSRRGGRPETSKLRAKRLIGALRLIPCCTGQRAPLASAVHLQDSRALFPPHIIVRAVKRHVHAQTGRRLAVMTSRGRRGYGRERHPICKDWQPAVIPDRRSRRRIMVLFATPSCEQQATREQTSTAEARPAPIHSIRVHFCCCCRAFLCRAYLSTYLMPYSRFVRVSHDWPLEIPSEKSYLYLRRINRIQVIVARSAYITGSARTHVR